MSFVCRNSLKITAAAACILVLVLCAGAQAEIQKIYVVFATHLDIGYTHPVDRVEMISHRNIDRTIDLCMQNQDLRYTIEEAWLLRQWLKRTDDPKRIEAMRKLIQEGRIEVCGVYATMHSNALGAEDANQIAYEGRRLQDELGFPIVTAMQNDVPGYDWAYPQILSKSGMRYMLAGLNPFIGGGPPTDDPLFYWEGIDGSRILLFPQIWYSGFQAWVSPWLRNQTADEEADAKILTGLITEFEKNGYPYEYLLLQDNQSDNQGPDGAMRMVEKIRRWNQAGRKPVIQIATPREFFEAIEIKYADQIPVRRGHWGANWDQIKARGPMMTTAYRRAQSQIPSAEKLLAFNSILLGDSFPRYDVAEIWDNLLSYGEHSAPEGLATPAFTRREILWSNQLNFNYTFNAFNKTESLLIDALPRMRAWTGQTSDTLIVFNPTSWERTDLVYAPLAAGRGWFAESGQLAKVQDTETAALVPFDIIGMSEWGGDACGEDSWQSVSFVATKVPPMGYRIYRLIRRSSSDALAVSDADYHEASSSVYTLENDRFRVQIEPRQGAVSSIYDKQIGRDLLLADSDATESLFNYLVSQTPITPEKVETRLVEGKTFKRLEIRRPGTWFPETDIRLTDGVDYVEVRNVFDRQEWKRIHPAEGGMHGRIAMPFAIPPSKAKLFVSGPNGYRQIPADLFPHSIRDSWASSAFVALSDGERTVMASAPVDFIFSPMGPWEPTTTATQPYFPLSTQALMESFEADTRSGHFVFPFTDPVWDGRIVRRYAITSRRGAFEPREAQRFGWGYRQNMLAQILPGSSSRRWRQPDTPSAGLSAPAMVLIKTSDPDVWVQAFRRSLFAGQDFFILRLQETAGNAKRPVSIEFAPELNLQWAAKADMVERKGDAIPVDQNIVRLDLGPFETSTIALGFMTQGQRSGQ